MSSVKRKREDSSEETSGAGGGVKLRLAVGGGAGASSSSDSSSSGTYSTGSSGSGGLVVRTRVKEPAAPKVRVRVKAEVKGRPAKRQRKLVSAVDLVGSSSSDGGAGGAGSDADEAFVLSDEGDSGQSYEDGSSVADMAIDEDEIADLVDGDEQTAAFVDAMKKEKKKAKKEVKAATKATKKQRKRKATTKKKRKKVAAKKAAEVPQNGMYGALQLQSANALSGAGTMGIGNFSHLQLKPSRRHRPLWVMPNGEIVLESFSPTYDIAYQFLIAVAEPQVRARLVQEYRITQESLRAASMVGLTADKIVHYLDKLSKVELPARVVESIHFALTNVGKLLISNHGGRYFLQAREREVLETLLADEQIQQACQGFSIQEQGRDGASGGGAGGQAAGGGRAGQEDDGVDSTTRAMQRLQDEGADDEDDDEVRVMYSLEFKAGNQDKVARQCTLLNFPPRNDYGFRNDRSTPQLDIEMKPTTTMRPYQERALRKVFGGEGRVSSGVVCLPCGAGKTLVGVTAVTTIGKSAMVLCTSGVAVLQWKSQFLMWTNVSERSIRLFTKDSSEIPHYDEPCIIISTYSMVSFPGKRSAQAERWIKFLRRTQFGILVFDEVHVVPAKMFRLACSNTRAHCKLGLTATLVREDDLIKDLTWLVGPKLYEANWIDLVDNNYLARVACFEVWATMPPKFYKEYLQANKRRRKLLYLSNPNKFTATEYLMRYHEQRGDKILIFSDVLDILRKYSELLKRPIIEGKTSDEDRVRILRAFQHSSTINTICISKVGDNSIDLPSANVVIQVAAHFGSRRQEAQRLGRILRKKANVDGGFNAFFYSVVSADTCELFYSTKRQKFLVEQGYMFKVITNLPLYPGGHLQSQEEQDQFLAEVLSKRQEASDTSRMFGDDDDDALASSRMATSLAQLNRDGNFVYMEYHVDETGKRKKHERKVARSSLFAERKRARLRKKREAERAAAEAQGLDPDELRNKRAATKKKIRFLDDDDDDDDDA